MTSRRRARLWAVQQLFQLEFNREGAARAWEMLTDDQAPPKPD